MAVKTEREICQRMKSLHLMGRGLGRVTILKFWDPNIFLEWLKIRNFIFGTYIERNKYYAPYKCLYYYYYYYYYYY